MACAVPAIPRPAPWSGHGAGSRRMWDALSGHPRGMTVKQLAAEAQVTEGYASQFLYRQQRAGRLIVQPMTWRMP